MTQFQVGLEDLDFYSYSGVFKEEKVLGNHLSVSLFVTLESLNDTLTLEESVDYTVVYKLVSEVIGRNLPLLETICSEIINAIKNRFPQVIQIEVTVRKHNPPIGGLVHNSQVKAIKDFRTL